jgi:hypothetical protein
MVGAPLSINYSLFSMTWVLGGGAMRPRAPMVRVLLVELVPIELVCSSVLRKLTTD